MTTTLTRRHQAIVDFLRAEVTSKGYPPSIRAISDKVGLEAHSSVISALGYLADKGLVEHRPQHPIHRWWPVELEVPAPRESLDVKWAAGRGESV